MKNKIVSVIVSAVITVSCVAFIAMAAETEKPFDSSKPVQTEEGRSKKGRPQGKSNFGHKGDKIGVSVLSVAASVLGKTEDEIKDSVKAGKVGDLLILDGKVEEFKTAYLSELKQKLDAYVDEAKMTQEKADEKYASEQTKMDAYDGTTHLCGGTDHSKMFNKRGKENKTAE